MAAPSLKRLQIDRANRTIVIVVAVAVFVTFFSLFSAKALFGQLGYQNRVIDAKQKALTQLKTNINAEKQLAASYQKFIGSSQNIIGGSSTGNGANDGNNADIILDALPSQYNFPALTSSIQNILTSQGVKVDSISGTDEQASISGGPTTGAGAAAPAPVAATSTTTPAAVVPGSAVAMPFQFTVDGSYQNIQNLITALQKSIRPMQILTMQITGDQNDLNVTVSAQSYYQPENNFKITTETIK